MIDFSGMWTATVCPFAEDGAIDWAAMEKLLAFQAVSGMRGVFVNGTERGMVYAFLEGCIGNLSGIPNGFPEPYIELWAKYRAGDLAGSMIAQKRIDDLRTAIRVGPHLTDLKVAITLRGVPAGFSRPPLRRFTGAETSAMGERLRAIGVIGTTVAARG